MGNKVKIEGIYFIKYLLPSPCTGESNTILKLKVMEDEDIFEKVMDALKKENNTLNNIYQIKITSMNKL